MPEFKDLSKLLDPQSVAIVGVSPRTGASARIRENIQRFNFPGEIYLVNPRYETLWGEKCYASLDDLPETVDNAIFCVPAPTVVSLLEKSTGNYFRAAIVRGADFGEDRSPEGLKRKAFLEDFARAHEVRFCGPNWMGLVSMRAHAFLFPETRFAGLREGGLAIVSQRAYGRRSVSAPRPGAAWDSATSSRVAMKSMPNWRITSIIFLRTSKRE